MLRFKTQELRVVERWRVLFVQVFMKFIHQLARLLTLNYLFVT